MTGNGETELEYWKDRVDESRVVIESLREERDQLKTLLDLMEQKLKVAEQDLSRMRVALAQGVEL